MNQLKPCPFCGGEAERKTNKKYRKGYLAVVGCKRQLCPAEIQQATVNGTAEDAYKYAESAWNNRKALASKEAALIMQSVQEYILGLQDKEFQVKQIKIAQSVFKNVLGLRLSDDGRTVGGF